MVSEGLKYIDIIIYVDNQKKTIPFKFEENTYIYEGEENEKIILVKTKDDYNEILIIRKDKSKYLQQYSNEIIETFKIAYELKIEEISNAEKLGVEHTEDEEPDITIPYSPNSIKIQPARFTLKEIYEMIIGDEYFEPMLDLSPDFQRNYVWDITRKSRLIESILLQIPLPVIYLARDREGKYQVVDGVQRLSVIKEYFSNGFRLVNLEYLNEECEGKYYSKENKKSLHVKFVRQLRTYQIDCYVIEPSTPIDVKFDIFKRLNTGGKSLNNQEIRNSIMKPKIRDFIRKLAECEEFKKATNYKIKPKRMMDQEFILRYLAFYMLYKENYLDVSYESNMHKFLNEVVEKMNSNPELLPFDKLEKAFKISMRNSFVLFGEHAFKKLELVEEVKFKKVNKSKLINKALFTAISVMLSDYKCRNISLSMDLAKYLDEREYLYQSITYGTSNQRRIDTTFMLIEEFLEEKIGDMKC